MKHGLSLQEERDALLDHIHASRTAYRRMLTDINTDEEQKFENEAARLTPKQRDFPRSMTMRWITKHPYLSVFAVAGVAAVVVIGPRRAVQTVASRVAAIKQSTAVKRSGPILGALTALATAVLRNPARVQLAIRTYSSVAQFLRRKRQGHL